MSVQRTPAARFVWEMEPVKGSRFVATVAPAGTAAEADAVVDSVAAEHPGASHHCFAWRLSDGTSRSSDDGEPSGSAGRPILAYLEGKQIENAVVVVSRWFGGTKLGVGGLVRAYGGCAGKALDRAPIDERLRTTRLRLVHSYADTGAVAAVLAELDLVPAATEYGAEVTVALEVPEAQAAAVRLRVAERTAARAQVLPD